MSELILECTTELEAVNSILASVGESPVVSLDSEFVDAEMAAQLLRQELRRLQLGGWTFNTDLNVLLEPDADGFIWLPLNLLRLKIADSRYVARGERLYDRSIQTFTFDGPVTAHEMVTALVFEDCPEAARQFATIRAGRRFQDRYQGDNILHQFQAADETAAWSAFLNNEAETAQWNMLNNSALTQRMKRYRPPSTYSIRADRA